MATTHNKDQGTEIEGTRITVYTLLPHFLDSISDRILYLQTL